MVKVSSFVNGLPAKLDVDESYFFIDEYDDGKVKGGVRAWNEGHEEVIRRFYHFSSPPVVSALRPHEHQDDLDEASFASRERGRPIVLANSRAFQATLLNPSFSSTYLDPFEAKTVKEREDVSNAAEAHRKLVPEITLEQLCSGDGKGLRRLVDRLNAHLDRFDLVSNHPFPHDGFFRMFALDGKSRFPLSKSCRAYQDEMCLIRHSTLLAFLFSIFQAIRGRPVTKSEVVIGNVASDLNPSTAPHLLDDGKEEKKNLLVTGERCIECMKSAEAVGLAKLFRCEKCLRIGRVELYCSSRCQRIAWPTHKKTCGVKLSEAFSVPNFKPSSVTPGPTTPSIHPDKLASLHPLRRYVLSGLDSFPNEIWHVSDTSSFGFEASQRPNGVALTTRIRTAMRATAYKALRDSDPTSIDILACTLVPYDLTDRDPTLKRVGSQIRKDFQAMFELDDAQLAAATERGEKELEKPERRGERECWIERFRCSRRAAWDEAGEEVKQTHGERALSSIPELHEWMTQCMFRLDEHPLERIDRLERRAEAKEQPSAGRVTEDALFPDVDNVFENCPVQ
ncbi:hypothetical protein JCM8097_001890 [Rhodosporidiobolus ruineniae]